MKLITLLIVMFAVIPLWAAKPCSGQKKFVLLMHGGAGAGSYPEKIRKQQEQVMAEALKKGQKVLSAGGTAVDAVETSIKTLEDSPIFNAGRGGIPNKAGFVELDSSIMRGKDMDAGATAATRKVRNPISAARAAMEKSEHLMFVGEGADNFAKSQGLKMATPKFFKVSRQLNQPNKKFGTVGAVALDRCGNLAAGTSTGGFNSKVPGRVGDSPVIGAGTYADNKSCAVSATGHGEYFIRWSAAYRISALMSYKNMGVKKASHEVIHNVLKPAGGKGGVIALDKKGNMAWPYSSQGMIRGYVNETGKLAIGIFKKMKAIN